MYIMFDVRVSIDILKRSRVPGMRFTLRLAPPYLGLAGHYLGTCYLSTYAGGPPILTD